MNGARPSLRLRQMIVIVRPAVKVMTWQPMVCMILAGTALVAVGSRSGAASRLSLAGAGLAAACCYLIDDPGALTIASSPTPLPARRLLRVMAAALGGCVGWGAAAMVAAQRGASVELWPSTLEFATFVAVGLAAAAVVASRGEATSGGITGVVVTLGCFASTFLPGPSWLPFPPDPGAPGATTRLVGVFLFACGVVVAASRDPAIRNPHKLARLHGVAALTRT